METRIWAGVLLIFLGLAGARPGAAAVPRSNPPAGIRIGDGDRAELERGTAALAGALRPLRDRASRDEQVRQLLPDVEIYHKAVDWALRHDEFFRSNEVAIARTLLAQGQRRAQALAEGNPFWLSATGMVIRGFRSRIDGSAQPYGILVPPVANRAVYRARRLDVWLHGRDDKQTELKFIGERMRSNGEFVLADGFVLHPYGRFCNAFKFAGETDVFEALAHAKQWYPVDDQRVGLRGFSMGGAGVWHLAAHHPAVWTAAAPGAGFAETAEYTGALTKGPAPSWWEQKLWRLYDATRYAANFHNLPVIAYSGEVDKQKQAADIMASAMKAEGLELPHLIGPGTGHKYEPGARRELIARFDALMNPGRNPHPTQVVFTTCTLRYARFALGEIQGLTRSWEPARIAARLGTDQAWVITTTNIEQLRLNPAALAAPTAAAPGVARVRIDGQELRAPDATENDRGTKAGWVLARREGRWTEVPSGEGAGAALAKKPGLQGPIDDAFMDRFVVVGPTRPALHAPGGRWVEAELARFTNEWRAQFRGDVQLLAADSDAALQAASAGDAHLVLFGDPASNPLLARLLPRLPLRWDARTLELGPHRVDARTHLPMLIYPNPLNPARYVVVNTGPTYLDFGAASNAQQTPKLPDFAMLDITVPRADRLGAGVKVAGFFDERWRVALAAQP